MPRYWTGWGMALSPHDQRAAERRHGPAEVHRDLGVLHLATAARRIVVRVDALGGPRAVVVHGPAELPHALAHHGHAVCVALAQDGDGPLATVARALGGGHDEAGRVVGLEAAVEEVEGLHDPARADDVLDAHALLEDGLRVLRRVLAVRDLHVGDLLRRRPVL